VSDPEIDIGKIRQRASDIRNSIREIRELLDQPAETFHADRRNLYALAHLLLVSVEAAAAICNHLVSRMTRRAPASYSECFEEMKDLGLLETELIAQLVPIARFRNVLVHRYWDVPDHEIRDRARHITEVLDQFLRELGRKLVIE